MIPRALLMLFTILLLALGTGLAKVNIPNTPAGQTLQTWLEAFNSGDRAKLESYIKNVDHSETVDGLLSFRNVTGGLDLLSIESSEPLHIRFRVKNRGGDNIIGLGNLLVKDGHPPTVETFGLRALPPGVEPVNVVVDSALRKRVIDGIAAKLNEFYIDAPLARQMVDAVQTHARAGDYDAITDGDAFAARLTADLRAVSHDRHLHVDFSPFKVPPMGPPTPDDEARFHHDMEHDNCAFQKVEILPDNIAYIQFNGFMDAQFCGPTVAAAMGFAAHADAIIFDIRQNGAASPIW